MEEIYINGNSEETEKDNIEERGNRNPIYLTILECTSDRNSFWYLLRGTPNIITKIWNLVVKCWKETILIADEHSSEDEKPQQYIKEFYFCRINFPKPKDICVNMMPFILAMDFKNTKLPDYMKGYFDDFIKKCLEHLSTREELGKVCYLSVHEGRVDGNKSQRRPGLHTECPGSMMIGNTDITAEKGKGLVEMIYKVTWGEGEYYPGLVKGGIFMASNVSNSCMVWNCQVPRDSSGKEIIGNLGDMEHLREFLPEGETVQANDLIWITDRTPHESLPVPDGTYRQWCRLVTSQVSHWFMDHSAKNPNGVTPDRSITQIVKGSKFDERSLKIIEYPDSEPSTSSSRPERNIESDKLNQRLDSPSSQDNENATASSKGRAKMSGKRRSTKCYLI